MKKILVPALVCLLFYGCVKSDNSPACTDLTPASEETTILNFCGANGIIYQKDSSGIYYQILDPGAGPTPVSGSNVSYTYVTKFLNGTVLDQTTTPYTNRLSDLIQGLQIVMPLISKNGHIKAVIPSSLCYGCTGVSPDVPPNAILYFDLTITDVQ